MLGSSKNILRLIILFIHPERSIYSAFALYVPNVQFTHQEDKPAVTVETITNWFLSDFLSIVLLNKFKRTARISHLQRK